MSFSCVCHTTLLQEYGRLLDLLWVCHKVCCSSKTIKATFSFNFRCLILTLSHSLFPCQLNVFCSLKRSISLHAWEHHYIVPKNNVWLGYVSICHNKLKMRVSEYRLVNFQAEWTGVSYVKTNVLTYPMLDSEICRVSESPLMGR